MGGARVRKSDGDLEEPSVQSAMLDVNGMEPVRRTVRRATIRRARASEREK